MCVMVRHKLRQSFGRAVRQYTAKCQGAFLVISQKMYLLITQGDSYEFFKSIQDALGTVFT